MTSPTTGERVAEGRTSAREITDALDVFRRDIEAAVGARGVHKAEAEAAVRDSLATLLRLYAEAEARGRAKALAEVDAAFEAVAVVDLAPGPGCSSVVIGICRDAWPDGVVAWSCDRNEEWASRPTATILVAAAALADDAGGAS